MHFININYYNMKNGTTGNLVLYKYKIHSYMYDIPSQ